MASEDCQAKMEAQTKLELNTISWTQIPATDFARASSFYTKIFGWHFTPFAAEGACGEPKSASAYDDIKPSDPIFMMMSFKKDDLPHGGLVKVKAENHLSPALHPNNPDKMKVAVNVTITVESIDEKLEQIVKEGGEVYMPKMEIPGGMGCVAYFLDTEKNVMGLWSQK